MMCIFTLDKTMYLAEGASWRRLPAWLDYPPMLFDSFEAVKAFMERNKMDRTKHYIYALGIKGLKEVPNFMQHLEAMRDRVAIPHRPDFDKELEQLVAKYVQKAQDPVIVYKTAADQLEVYLKPQEPDVVVARQLSGQLRVLVSGDQIVGMKITGLLQLMQPAHDPSIKFMEVPLDIVEECCVRFNDRRTEAAYTMNVEEERFFFWVNIHWPGLKEKFPWLIQMRA